MKNIVIIALSFLCYINVNAQKDSVQLLPDQNPNFQKSQNKIHGAVCNLNSK